MLRGAHAGAAQNEGQAGGWSSRTVVDDVPRLWHQAAGLCSESMVPCARGPKGVAVELRTEAKLQLQVVRRQGGQRAA